MPAATATRTAASPDQREHGPALAQPGTLPCGQQLPLLQEALAALALSGFVGSILAASALLLLSGWAVLFHPSSPWTWTLLALVLTATFVPLRHQNGRLADAYMSFCCSSARDYFPVTVLTEEGAVFDPQRAYVVGLEPHSALPTAMPSVFGLQSRMLPDGLRGRTHGLASSVCFQIPLVRHVYWWNGIRPITRASMRRLLQRNHCVVLVPGGVQECLHMQPGRETAFLSPRRGFIRVAMQAGAPVVPCFAFGQSRTYNWLRLGPPLVSDGFVQALSRRMGMVPMLLVGRWGSAAPNRARMTVAIGRPIELPQHDAPPDELVQPYLDAYIAALQALFERHKAAAGYPGWRLVVL